MKRRTKPLEPLITVVTPSLNQGHFLEQTIRSVLNQEYPNVEYIIIDGGSTDNSVDIIRSYESKLAYWVSEPDAGQAAAIRKGFDMAKGDVLCWLNADDLFLVGALSSVADYFSNNGGIHAVSAGGYYINEEGRFLKKWPPPVSLGCPLTFEQMKYVGMGSMIQPATFWTRDAYMRVGGLDPIFEIVMDEDLFRKLARLGTFGNLRRMVVCFRWYSASKGTRNHALMPGERSILEERYGTAGKKGLNELFNYWRWRGPQVCERLYLGALYRIGVLKLPEPA